MTTFGTDSLAGADIIRTQNELPALRLLLAQRRMYSRAKRWNYPRAFGIGIVAPVIAVSWPSTAVWV